MAVEYLSEGTVVTFELDGSLPIFREPYVSQHAGKVVLKGLIHQSAHLETKDGTRYRTLPARRDRDRLSEIAYPLIRLQDRVEVCRLLTPIEIDHNRSARLRYYTMLDNRRFIWRQISPGQRGADLWDGTETARLVERTTGGSLIAPLRLLAPVPVLVVLLFPWLDNQMMTYRGL
jgi:hypothetical protein